MDDFDEFLSEMEDRGSSRVWRCRRKVGTPYVEDRCPFGLTDHPAQMTNRSEDEKRCDECGLMFAAAIAGGTRSKARIALSLVLSANGIAAPGSHR
jgi:hypothetical protein